MACVLTTWTGGRLQAQGAVTGRVVLLERAHGVSRDLMNGVVQLEALDGMRRDRNDALMIAAIDMRAREFVPRVQLVRTGGKVGFPNSDPFSHNVFSNSALGAFDLGLYRSRVTRTASFSRPGAYAIYCNISRAWSASWSPCPRHTWRASVATGASRSLACLRGLTAYAFGMSGPRK